jgi:GGDEF domain-containing protein
MRLNLVRQILASFLIVCAGFALAWFAALYLLQSLSNYLTVLAHDPGGATNDLQQAQRLLEKGQWVVLLLGLGGFLGGLAMMVVAAGQAVRMLERLKLATRQLANVVLDQDLARTEGTADDDLEREVRAMMLKIQASQRLYLDASPLTRLPGNIAIEQVLKTKMAHGEKFALCYIDLDDFKAYNDRYGYARGSELIKLTGEIIYRAKDAHGAAHDFVGHIGGDDFVLITSPENVALICEAIIAEFDRMVPAYYDEDDRRRTYTEGLDRYGVARRFPLMSISIAVVSDALRTFDSPLEIARAAAEIKDYVKALPGSNYLVDRRLQQRDRS